MSRIDAFTSSSASPEASARQTGAGLAGAGQGAVGQLGDQQIQVDDGPSVLSAAAEELALYQAEKAEAKRSAERKKTGVPQRQPMGEEAIAAYLHAAQADEDLAALAPLAQRMLSGAGDPLQHARQAFGEATQQFMALQYALQQGEREGAAADQLEALRDALDDLEADHGPVIRADINTVGVAAQGARSRQEVARFQATYRDVVLGHVSLAGTLQMALERFGLSDFAGGLARLVQALGQDLASASPSVDPARLQSLAKDLYHLSVASTVLDACQALHARIEARYGALRGLPAQLMQGLVKLSAEKWVSGSRFTTLARDYGATGVEVQIHFLSGIQQLMREMPVEVFVDLDQRQTVFAAIQDALDEAIDREDA